MGWIATADSEGNIFLYSRRPTQSWKHITTIRASETGQVLSEICANLDNADTSLLQKCMCTSLHFLCTSTCTFYQKERALHTVRTQIAHEAKQSQTDTHKLR